MFCSLVNAIEMCKTEGVVDVFQVVKALRIQKPGAVTTAVILTDLLNFILCCINFININLIINMTLYYLFFLQVHYRFIYDVLQTFLDSFSSYLDIDFSKLHTS